MGVFELHNAQKTSLGSGLKCCLNSGVAPQTPIPLYPGGEQKCFWIPKMVLFELHNAKTYCLSCGVAAQTPVPLYLIGQRGWFWIPRMGVFELHNAKKPSLGSGVAPIPLCPYRSAKVFLDTYDGGD